MTHNISEAGMPITDDEARAIGRMAVSRAVAVLAMVGVGTAVFFGGSDEGHIATWEGDYRRSGMGSDVQSKDGRLYPGDVLDCPEELVHRSDISYSRRELVPGSCDVATVEPGE